MSYILKIAWENNMRINVGNSMIFFFAPPDGEGET
jgi:hypothetical protein